MPREAFPGSPSSIPEARRSRHQTAPRAISATPLNRQKIDHFLGMLAKTRKRIEPAQIDQIKQALQDAAAKMKEGARTTAK